MSLLDDYPEMFPDRCDIYPATPSGSDNSGGRTDNDTPSMTDVPCSVQPVYEQMAVNVGTTAYSIQTAVMFGESPGNLPSNSRIKVTSLLGDPPVREAYLSVKRLTRSGLDGLVVWQADCTGQA